MREIDAWPKAGGGHVTVVTMGLGLDSVNGHIDLPGLTREHAQLGVIHSEIRLSSSASTSSQLG